LLIPSVTVCRHVRERRKAERDAAKRAPRAGAVGAAGAAAALANLNVNPVGDWTTQAEDHMALFRAVGAENVRRRAGEGDREAQWSQGIRLMSEDGVAGTALGAAGRSPKADVGLELFAPHTFQSLTRPRRYF